MAGALALICALAVVIVSFLATRDDAVDSLWNSIHPNSMAHEVTSEGGTSTLVDIPLALISDYYEHGLEHAPPRDPSGVMQKREAYYRPPSDPVSFIRSKLSSQPADIELGNLLTAWEHQWLHGQLASTDTISRFEQTARSSSLDAIALLHAAKGFQFLDGDTLAAGFIHAGLAKAQIECADIRRGDSRSINLLNQLDQTKCLWNLKDFPAVEARFVLARRLYPPLSVESRRAGYLLADALFYQKRFREAESLIETVMAEHRQVGDLGALDRGDLYEMNFQLGYLQFAAGDLEASISNLKRVRGGGEHDQVAADALFRALLQVGSAGEAQSAFQEFNSRFKTPSAKASARATDLEEAIQLKEWRHQMTLIESISPTALDNGTP
jgi:tetratricopeptide (TPR) repeat protein